MINVGRGTQAWAGFSVADSPLVHKDPQTFIVQKSFGLKQDVKWNPIPVLTQGMQEPLNYRFEGMHAVAGNAQTPLYPEQTMQMLKSLFGAVTTGMMTAKIVMGTWSSSLPFSIQFNSETAITFGSTGFGSIELMTENLLALINAVVGSVVTAAYVDAGDHALGIIVTGNALFTITRDPSNGQYPWTYTADTGYVHTLKGQDAVPNLPLAFTFYEDLSQMNLVG